MAEEKTFGPDQVMEFTGIELDSVGMMARLPTNKIEKCLVKLREVKDKDKVSLKTIQQLKVRIGRTDGLFTNKQGRPLTKNVFAKMLKIVSLDAGFNLPFLTHSFRIGGATQAHKMGYTEVQIKALGRWRSAAYAEYVRGSKPLVLN